MGSPFAISLGFIAKALKKKGFIKCNMNEFYIYIRQLFSQRIDFDVIIRIKYINKFINEPITSFLNL